MANLRPNSSYSMTGLVLQRFKSQWFLVPQGTGILAVVLHQLPYQFHGLSTISDILWVFTIVLLLLSLLTYTLRILKFPAETAQIISSQINETACLASIPITLTSIVQMIDLSLVHVWGPSWGKSAYVLWWISCGMSVVACIGIPYVFATYEPPGVKGLDPAVNLPLIAALTAAAGGGTICRYGGLDSSLQVPVIIVSYLLLGMALPVSLGFSIVFLARLLANSSPTGMKTYQDMILCGPWGQGSFALQILGSVVMRGSFGQYARGVFLTIDAAKPVGYASIFIGLMSWGQGTFWWAFATISIIHSGFNDKGRWKGLKFGLLTWSLVFPWGVYTNACIELGSLLDSRAFNIWGTVLALILTIIWILNMFLTVKGILDGTILDLEHGWNRKAYANQHPDNRNMAHDHSK